MKVKLSVKTGLARWCIRIINKKIINLEQNITSKKELNAHERKRMQIVGAFRKCERWLF